MQAVDPPRNQATERDQIGQGCGPADSGAPAWVEERQTIAATARKTRSRLRNSKPLIPVEAG